MGRDQILPYGENDPSQNRGFLLGYSILLSQLISKFYVFLVFIEEYQQAVAMFMFEGVIK